MSGLKRPFVYGEGGGGTGFQVACFGGGLDCGPKLGSSGGNWMGVLGSVWPLAMLYIMSRKEVE